MKKYFSSNKFLCISIIIIAGFSMQFYSCKRKNLSSENAFSFTFPDSWPDPVYNFEGNPPTEDKFILGRTLFYERKLSLTNAVSCGTCHQSFAAFSQLDHDVSHGVYNRIGTRNSQGLFNLNWNTSFFWDGRVNHIEVQALNPLTDSVEMGESLENVLFKLSQDSLYAELFTKAYGSPEISAPKMLKALAVFMGMMVSSESKYDKYMRGELSLTDREMRGLHIYENNCASCHPAPLFTDYSFRSNGLPLKTNKYGLIDSGRAEVSPYDESNLYKFRVPSLRNLKYTYPYMHDGRYNTLTQVLNHYVNIDSTAFNLDPLLKNPISLDVEERRDLIAFLNTLNDEEFVKDKKFMEQ